LQLAGQATQKEYFPLIPAKVNQEMLPAIVGKRIGVGQGPERNGAVLLIES